jgi:hypothetical protein
LDGKDAREEGSVIVQLQGGLGNQMFQYAFGKSVAKAAGQDVAFVKERSHKRTYSLDAFNVDIKFAPEMTGSVFVEQPFCYNPAVYDAARNGLNFNGHWQTERYFDVDLVRKHFTLRDQPSSPSLYVAGEIVRNNSAFIHVRRTDYVGINETYHGLMTMEYYRQAVHRVLLENDDVKFYLFSDDPDWCEHAFAGKLDSTVVRHNKPGDGERPGKEHEDLWLMSLCRHGVIANSSFSWWGAWLGENRYPKRTVVAPKKWFATPTLESKDIVPERWVKYE